MKIFKRTNIKTGLVMLLTMLTATTSFAQTEPARGSTSFEILTLLLFALVIIVLIVVIMLLRVLNTMLKDQAVRKAEEEGIPFIEEESLWAKLDRKYLTQAVELKNEQSIVLDHNYDGIKELDNHLPPWWKYLFVLSAVFAVAYMLIYHVFLSLPLQSQEYETEMALAAEKKASLAIEGGGVSIDENSVEYSTDEAILANGAKVFSANCAACHKSKGEGGIGPNLTDEYWINNGGSISHIFSAVKYGFPSKGMIAWESLLSPQQMNDVSSYVKSIYGSNPPNAKAAQGELYQQVDVVADSTIVSE